MLGSLGKRVADVVIALIILVFAAPVIVAVLLLVWYDVGWPVFFVQQRPGKGTAPFRMVKFRTMRALSADQKFTPEHDATRLTSIGRLLRSTSLDELPELWNVLTGDMSLVGPRPLLADYLPVYTERERKRHDVRPGITGWAQVNGRNALDWSTKLELDVWYVENWSMRLDFQILLRTIAVVLSRRDVSAVGVATMTRLDDSRR